MRVVYLDEAGINKALEPYVVVAGVIVNADEKWSALEQYFRKLSKQCFPGHEGHPIVFHASDIWHGYKLFDRAKWPRQKRLKLLRQLAKVTHEFRLPVVMGYAHRDSTTNLLLSRNPKASEKAIRLHLHASAFFSAVRRVEWWMSRNTTNEVAMLIAEDTAEVKDIIRFLHRAYTDRTLKMRDAFSSERIIDAVHFAKKDQSLLLQLADNCAFFMKRKLMAKKDAEPFFQEFASQIVWHQQEGHGIAVRVKASDVERIRYPGSLDIGPRVELKQAFVGLLEGLQSGQRIDNLRHHIQMLQDAQDQSFRTPEGRAFLAARPTLKRRIDRQNLRLNQR
ncbi:MAG TPA: DUF3800 domain-containing protein [Xanthobacteraceae bacterium]|nr:DUF3800 domain-containing protein [Xanthobacteraceae bacterium]